MSGVVDCAPMKTTASVTADEFAPVTFSVTVASGVSVINPAGDSPEGDTSTTVDELSSPGTAKFNSAAPGATPVRVNPPPEVRVQVTPD